MKIRGQKVWFTSDTHFCHKNVLSHDNRPFSSIEEHDETIIRNWNSVVDDKDVVFHLGDFCFSNSKVWESIISRLNGDIHLVKGNHDKLTNAKLFSLFKTVSAYNEIYVFDPEIDDYQFIVLSHYSHRVWNKKHHGSWNLYGHSHGSLMISDERCHDVGTNVNNYTPLSFEQIKNIINAKNITEYIHHGE